MKKIHLLGSTAVMAVFAACGDDITEVYETTTGIQIVAAGEELGDCTKDNAGEMLFVTDSSAVYFCADGDWLPLNGTETESRPSSIDTVIVSKVDTVRTNNVDTLLVKDTTVISKVDTVVVKDTSVVSKVDTIVVKDTLIIGDLDTYDTVTTEYLNQEMLAAGEYGILVDNRDRKVYRTIKIGQQTWMAQNLNYTDGGVFSYCLFNSQDSCSKFGRLYTWAVAMGLSETYNTARAAKVTGADSIIRYPAQGICPNGWHVPSATEWETLDSYVSAYNTIAPFAEGIGTSLKSASDLIYWMPMDGVPLGTDRYGFSAIPNGRVSAGVSTEYTVWSLWWGATEASEKTADGRNVYCGNETLNAVKASKTDTRAIRCVKNAE